MLRHGGRRPGSSVALAALATASPFAWERFLRADAPRVLELVLHGLVVQPDIAAGSVASAARAESRLVTLSELTAAVETSVAGVVRSLLCRDVAETETLMTAGIDSLGAVELRNALDSSTGLQLPATLIFDYPTVKEIVGFIVATQAPQCVASDEAPVLRALAAESPLALPSCLAVCSVAGRVPSLGAGCAAGSLSGAADLIRAVPFERWDSDDAGLLPRFGGFVSEPSLFDAACFGMSSSEVYCMDTQQKMLLTVALQALADALGGGLVDEEGTRVGHGVGVVGEDLDALLLGFAEGGGNALFVFGGDGDDVDP
jgi:acyl carrier protein